jgi:hypothetical protein
VTLLLLLLLQGRIPWDPSTMYRATGSNQAGEDQLSVLDCADFSELTSVKAHTFFKG